MSLIAASRIPDLPRGITEQALATALANPAVARQQLDKYDAEDSLEAYIRQAWHVLEPGRVFKSGWAISQICEHLEAVHHGQIKRLLINVPPGFMKSMTVNVFFPTWEWGPRNMPHLRYVHASYTAELTIRDNVKARRLIRSSWYQERWGNRFTLSSDVDAKVKFETDKTGFKLATSIGGTGTGERGDRGIIDDPHKVKESESEAKLEGAILWFAEEWPSRINDPEESAQLCIMQRVNSRDVSGQILASRLGYEHLMIPMEYEPERRCYTVVVPPWLKSKSAEEIEAEKVTWARLEGGMTITRDEFNFPWEMDDTKREAADRAEMAGTLAWKEGYIADPRTEDGELAWPERFTKRHLEDELKPQLRMVGGTYAEAGQLQQRPAPRGGGMFQRKWFTPIDQHMVPKGGIVVRGWDLAGTVNKTSAHTASVKIRKCRGNIYIEHVTAIKGTPHTVEQHIKALSSIDPYGCVQDFPQDPGQAGIAQKGAIAKLLHGIEVRFSPETGTKEDRARPMAAQAEAGNVFIVRAEWNEDFLIESENFPRGMRRDRIDAMSRAYARCLKAGEDDMPAAPELIGGGAASGDARMMRQLAPGALPPLEDFDYGLAEGLEYA